MGLEEEIGIIEQYMKKQGRDWNIDRLGIVECKINEEEGWEVFALSVRLAVEKIQNME